MDKSKVTPWNSFVQSVEKYGDKISVVDKDESITYKEMLCKINDFSEFMNKISFNICGIYLPNSSRFIISMLALNKLNKVMVPLSFQLKGDSLFERINFADIEVIITDDKGYEEIKEIREHISLKFVIVGNDAGECVIHEFPYIIKEKSLDYEDVFGIFFTSGSTSKPKGIVISNSAIVGNGKAVAEFLKFDDTDTFLCTRPFAQAGPISGDILMPLICGAGIVILGDLCHPAIFLKAVQEYKITTTMLVSTTLFQIVQYPRINSFNVSSLKRMIFGGMTTPPSIMKEALEKIPDAGLYNTYGMSEASTKITFLRPDDILKNYEVISSVGTPIRGCKIKIMNESGIEAKVGEVGEIYVESDYVAFGYYKNKKLTDETMTSNGIRTKDMGYKDVNGFLYIVGRSDDLIIQGGNNVYPIEIKEVLLRNINIKEAEVFGVDDDKLGSKIVSMICLSEDSKMTSQEVYKWCRLNLEDKKIPKEIYIVDEIPKNDVGKISKNTLIEHIKNIELIGGK